MPDSPEVQQNFNATVYGVAGKVAGDQIIVISIKIENINARVHKGLTGLECIRLI
jgi:hypothetical protein